MIECVKGLEKEENECPECKKFKKRVKELEKELDTLRKKLARYENPHTPPSRQCYTTRRASKQGMGKPGRRKGHKGVTRPTPKPDRIVEATLENCPQCNTRLSSPIGFKTQIKEELPKPQPVTVIAFRLAKYKCPKCKVEIIASHPDCPREGRFGLNTLTHVTLLKYADRLPHRKVVEALEREHNLQVTAASVLDITRRVASALRPEYKQILARIRASKVVYVDETGIKVNGSKYWIWVFTTEHDTLVVIRKSRGKKVLKEVLRKDFKGVIVCDGWRSYINFTKRIQRCWAHLLREAKDLAGRFTEVLPFYKALKRLYEKLKQKLATKPPPEERSRLWRNAIKVLCYWLGKTYKGEEVTKFVQKVRNGLKYWFTFVAMPGIEPTNNRAERALREHVVIRKIIGTLRNTKGTRIHETVMSMLATWKQHKLNVQKTLFNYLQQNYT